jgi:hypothetical protein
MESKERTPMGFRTAVDIASSELALSQQIEWHLQGNHYPPVPKFMVKPCIEAIELANAGDWDSEVELPEGTSYKGSNTAPVRALVENHHLDAWIESDSEY